MPRPVPAVMASMTNRGAAAESPAEHYRWRQTEHWVRLFSEHLGGMFGLQVGGRRLSAHVRDRLALSRMYLMRAAGAGDLHADVASVPLATESMALVVLPWTLDHCADFEPVLAETDRVLMPEGCLLVFGTRPVSPWSSRLPRRPPAAAVLRRRLAQAGYDVLAHRRLLYRPPVSSERWLQRLAPLDRMGGWHMAWLAGGFALLARKRVIAMTPVGVRWNRPVRELAGDVVTGGTG